MKKLLLLFTITSLIVACSKETTFTKSVENRSSETLLLMIQSSDGGWIDSVVILPNTKTEIYNSPSGNAGSCEINIDSLYLLVFSGDTLKKDFLNSEDWTLTQENTLFGKTDWQECVFGIGDEDF